MIRKLFSIASAGALAAAGMAAIPAPAQAQGYYGGGGYQQVQYYGRGDRGYGRGYGRGYYRDRGYYGGRGYYRGRGYDRGRGYYGRGYRGRCRDNGTTGTIVGAIAGGLLGHEVGQGRYDRGDGTAGAIIGGGLGALAGRAIDRNC